MIDILSFSDTPAVVRDAVIFYLNREIDGLTGDALERKYAQLVSSHRSTLFSRWKYQNRTNPTEGWSYHMRTMHGDQIKYEFVSGNYFVILF